MSSGKVPGFGKSEGKADGSGCMTDSENVMGIAIVKKLAKDVRYFNAFNSNNVIIAIE